MMMHLKENYTLKGTALFKLLATSAHGDTN